MNTEGLSRLDLRRAADACECKADEYQTRVEHLMASGHEDQAAMWERDARRMRRTKTRLVHALKQRA